MKAPRRERQPKSWQRIRLAKSMYTMEWNGRVPQQERTRNQKNIKWVAASKVGDDEVVGYKTIKSFFISDFENFLRPKKDPPKKTPPIPMPSFTPYGLPTPAE